MGEAAPPRAVKKIFFRPNLQEKCESAPQDTKCTPASARVNFRTVFAWWLRFGGKKGRQLFWAKKVRPRQNPGYAYV